MNGPWITSKEGQAAADAAFARMIWWEAQKMIIKKLNITPEKDSKIEDAGDYAVKAFIERCNSGFFDVKQRVTE